MEQALARYLRWHRSVGHTPKTQRYHEQTITYLIKWLQKNGYPTAYDELHVDTVREWLEFQQDEGKSDYTIATRVRSLRAFTNWLVQEEWLSKDPLRRLKVPKVNDIPKEVLTPAQVDQLLASVPKDTLTGLRDRAIILTLYSTGIRANELCELHRDDINREQGLIVIRKAKGRKFRVVPLGPQVDNALDRYLSRRGDALPYLFVTEKGKKLGYVALRQILRRRGTDAGIPVSPHLFRHSFAVQYLRNGGKLEKLQAIMGHTTIQMTLRYARQAGIDLVLDHKIADPANSLQAD